MKILIKILFVLLGIMTLGIGSIHADASSGDMLTIFEEDGKYVLEGEARLMSSDDLSEIFSSEYILDGATVTLLNIKCEERLIIESKSISLKGDAEFKNGIGIYNSNIAMNEIAIVLSSGAINISSSCVNVISSGIEALASECFLIDRSVRSELIVESGKIISNCDRPAIISMLGSVKVLGGEILSSSSAAIENRSDLVISGSPKIEGLKYSVTTDKAPSLSYMDEYLLSNVSIKYMKSFERGCFYPILFETNLETVSNIKVYDEFGREQAFEFFSSSDYCDDKNFCAIYIPFVIKYFSGRELICEKKMMKSDTVLTFEPEVRNGYRFIGWSYNSEGTMAVDPSDTINDDISVYAIYELMPIEYLIYSQSYVYDGKPRLLTFEKLSHPLLDEGSLSFEWYLNGELISVDNSLTLQGVSDSGTYECKLLFTYEGDVSSVIVSGIQVEIEKCKIELPVVEDLVFNGEYQVPQSDDPHYEMICESEMNVGVYPLIFKLHDPENYSFDGFDSDTVKTFYKIIKAENFWVEELYINNVFENDELHPFARSRFGHVIYKFSDSYDGKYTETVPSIPGTYFVMASVSETENYFELSSFPVKFDIVTEEVIALSMSEPPSKLQYSAFDTLILDGGVFLAYYNSGRKSNIALSDLSVEYLNGECFRFGDSSVRISYGSVGYDLAVSVKKAIYDISGIKFQNASVMYNGEARGLDYTGTLPIGLDKIELKAQVEGFGVDVGEYTLRLVFSSESVDYDLPDPLIANLVIIPLSCNAVWENTGLIYNASHQSPKAFFYDEDGRKIELEIRGGRTNAGNYTADAYCHDNNYHIENASVNFVIHKADYDMSEVRWSRSDFIYDGREKEVYLIGLPSGVSVVGYTDNKGTEAGEYTSYVNIKYDGLNYNQPLISPYKWSIEKADYDLTGFDFYDTEVVYDGNVHYPMLVGDLPIGKDGTSPNYSFSFGALNANEDGIIVTVSFSTSSKNYNPPESILRSVKVVPRGITVDWQGSTFVYSGEECLPRAESSECDVSVFGAGVNAGLYVANAVALDSNYRILNPSFSFEIFRAENAWIGEIGVSDVYEGDMLSLRAEAASGTAVFRFFQDAECTVPIAKPSDVGVYWCIAEADGGINYLPLRSDAFCFEIIKLVPISLFVSLAKENFYAFSTLSFDDYDVTVKYNNGMVLPVDDREVIIDYPSGSLRVSDDLLVFSAFGITSSVPISVVKADFDMSAVFWSHGDFVYDGTDKSIYLDMLPEGLTVVSYIGNGVCESGEYNVRAEFIYDSENYNPPLIPDGVITINKKVLTIPETIDVVYSGEEMNLFSEYEGVLSVEGEMPVCVGTYPIKICLLDEKNYVIEGDEDGVLDIHINVDPKEITVNILSADIYLWDSDLRIEYEFVGEFFPEDTATPSFAYDGEQLVCTSDNPNYVFKLTGNEVTHHARLCPELERFIELLSFCTVLLLLIMTIIFFLKNKKRLCIAKSSQNKCNEVADLQAPKTYVSSDDLPIRIAVNASVADELISDNMAKTLVYKKATVKTWGRKRGIINVDTLSECFSDGDMVDINLMKSKKLVSQDTAYIKVLARGSVDKKLLIYANDFSFSAVKMIALTGGEAIKVNTVIIKRPTDPDE